MKAAPVIEATGLHAFYGASHVLHGVDFRISRGEAVALVGRNGMGKTTLLRCLIGLMPPRNGEVRIRGENMAGVEPHRVARSGVALVPEGRGIFASLTVREHLVMAARAGRDDRAFWTLGRVLELFPRLAERLDHMGSDLSGGEQQMLTIGRALMTNPDVLMLDEATEGLAPLVRKEIWSVLRRIKAFGIATLIVDKDIRSLGAVCERGIVLAKGRVAFAGPLTDLLRQPDLMDRLLGVA